ncbi:MAG: FtsW/RodA/SpoVE family cell cycle protein [Phycisphaerales bacterium]
MSYRRDGFLPPLADWPALTWKALVNGRAAWLVLFSSAALTMIGIYSINVAMSLDPKGWDALPEPAMKQALYAGVGILFCFAVAIPNYRLYGAASWALLGVAVCLLVFLLLPFVPSSIVRPRNGARGWIDLGPVDLQPSEFAKIAYVLVLSWYLRYRDNHRTFLGLLPPALITAIPVGLITLQPDLGSATLFVPALFAVLVAAGARLKHLAIIVVIAAAAAPAAYPMLKSHQKERFVGLFKQLRGDTSADQDINMQSVTAQRLAGAGGMSGLPEERSRTLLHFNALPERHNDMIFAVICNRFGFTGGLALLGLYALWVTGALITAAGAKEPFGRLVCVGLTGFIAAQVFVNVGMNIGLLPIVGITLPYVSHGGSSMLATWGMTGLIIGVAIRQPASARRKSFEWDDE